MKKYILVIILMIIFLSSKAQDLKDITIHELSDTKKAITLRDDLFFDVLTDRDTINNNENIFFYTGTISKVTKDSISIHMNSFTERIVQNNNVQKEHQIQYLEYDSIESLPTISFCKKDIYYIENSNDNAQSFHLTMGFISLFSGLVVAPLISINYKNGDFRKNIYYYTASISVAFSILNFSIVPSTTHKYWLRNYNKKKQRWYME